MRPAPEPNDFGRWPDCCGEFVKSESALTITKSSALASSQMSRSGLSSKSKSKTWAEFGNNFARRTTISQGNTPAHASGEPIQYVPYRDTQPADTRLAGAFSWLDHDARTHLSRISLAPRALIGASLLPGSRLMSADLVPSAGYAWV